MRGHRNVKFKMFILDIHLLYLSYIFRCHTQHHQEELFCHLLTTRYCYEATNYGFSSSYVVSYKRYNCACIGVTIYTQQLKSQVWPLSALC